MQKCLKLVRKCGRKSQTIMPFTLSFCANSNKQKKVIAYVDCQEFSFLYRRTLKQMKQKRSSGNAVHLFLRLMVPVRGGVEDTRLEAKAKDTKQIRGQGQGQPFRGQTLSRPRPRTKDTSA